jgi:KDO2-lipid IV(A) lauroyltransferase
MAGEKRQPLVLRAIDRFFLGAFNAGRFLARFLPPSVLWGVAGALGFVFFHTRRGSRKYLMTALHEVLPDVKDEREFKRMAKKIFAGPVTAMLDVIFLERHGAKIDARMEANSDVPGIIDKIDSQRAKGKGLILFSPHLGGIGIIHSMAARFGRPYTPVVMPPDLTPVPRYLTALMETAQKLGSDPKDPVFWAGKNVIPKVQEHLRQGKVMGMTYDLQGGTVVDFFGHPTAIASGVAHFACDSGAPILPGYLLRGNKPLDYTLTLFDPLEYELTGDREADVKRILETVVRQGEKMIRDAPDQWLGWLGMRGWRRKAQKMLKSEA